MNQFSQGSFIYQICALKEFTTIFMVLVKSFCKHKNRKTLKIRSFRQNFQCNLQANH